MNIPYYQVDAFTHGPFSGNPAGVCLLDHWLPDTLLQHIAAENNLSETAFVVQRGDDRFDLRWFTPAMEMDLCGHATLAASHIIFEHLRHQTRLLHFETKSGTLNVSHENGILTLDFPYRPASPVSAPPELLQGLGRTPVFVAKARDYLAVFESEDVVAALQPDMGALIKLQTLGIIVTAPGKNCDFVSRFFAPRAGVPEDPVTGSAHCTLVPYWAARLEKSELHAFQVSTRGGELFCKLQGDRVAIGGRAITYSSGTLHLPPQ